MNTPRKDREQIDELCEVLRDIPQDMKELRPDIRRAIAITAAITVRTIAHEASDGTQEAAETGDL